MLTGTPRHPLDPLLALGVQAVMSCANIPTSSRVIPSPISRSPTPRAHPRAARSLRSPVRAARGRAASLALRGCARFSLLLIGGALGVMTGGV